MVDEIEFGSDEHIAGLSREALEVDFRFLVDRNKELEDICEQMDALVRDMIQWFDTPCGDCAAQYKCIGYEGCLVRDDILGRARALGIPVQTAKPIPVQTAKPQDSQPL